MVQITAHNAKQHVRIHPHGQLFFQSQRAQLLLKVPPILRCEARRAFQLHFAGNRCELRPCPGFQSTPALPSARESISTVSPASLWRSACTQQREPTAILQHSRRNPLPKSTAIVPLQSYRDSTQRQERERSSTQRERSPPARTSQTRERRQRRENSP